MAKAIPAREALEPAPEVRRTVRLKIDGLRPVYNETDGDIFELEDVHLVDIDYPSVAEALRHSGVDPHDIDYLVDKFAQLTEVHLLAKALAQRTRRVG